MDIEEAILLLTHTSKDDFNLEEYQAQGRIEAIQVLLNKIKNLEKDVEDRFITTEQLKECSVKEEKAWENLISKQQELIELYLTEMKYYRDLEEKYRNLKQSYQDAFNTILLEFISKNKIKEKIEELKTRTIGASTGIYAAQVDILEEILDEE